MRGPLCQVMTGAQAQTVIFDDGGLATICLKAA